MLSKRTHHKPMMRAMKANPSVRCKCGHAAADHNKRKRQIGGIVFDAGACLRSVGGRRSSRDRKTGEYVAHAATVPCLCNDFKATN